MGRVGHSKTLPVLQVFSGECPEEWQKVEEGYIEAEWSLSLPLVSFFLNLCVV